MDKQNQTADLIPLSIWCDINGKKETTVRSWKSNGRITEGKQIFKDPVGSLWISCSAMQRWVKSNYNNSETTAPIRDIKISKGRKPRQTQKTVNKLRIV